MGTVAATSDALTAIVHIIQVSLAPVFLLSGIATLLNVFSTRYARVAEGKRPGPANGFSVGRENFEVLIRERLGFALSLDEAEAQGYALIGKLTAEIRAELKKYLEK